MKDSLRRLVLFVAIVGLGSAMIFVDIPLIYMLLLIVAVGFILLIVLGTITVAEIKNTFSRLTPANLRGRMGKAAPLQKAEKKPAVTKDTGERKAEPAFNKKSAGPTSAIQTHLSLLVSSIGSLGKILTDHKRPKKKVEDIDKLLEHTITEKVTRSSALESAAAVPEAAGPERGGTGGAFPQEQGNDADPFFSLSGEELETGLLDGLDEPGLSTPSPRPSGLPAAQDADTGLSMPDLEMPPLPDETADEASAILAAHAGEMSEENGTENSGEAISENLGDLDSINLDEIDLGDDSAMLETPMEPAPPQPAGPAPGSGSLIPATPITAAGAQDAEDQSDISSFAAGTASGTDDDMLSSLATDIKHVKKEKDVSLLRELKDFKAPATDIEKELSDITEQLNSAAGKGAKKRSSSAQGSK
jgi:hypothetical protein